MKLNALLLRRTAVFSLVVLAGTAIAQDPLKGILTTSFGDVSALKQKAEAGDPRAQVALAGVLEQHLHGSKDEG